MYPGMFSPYSCVDSYYNSDMLRVNDVRLVSDGICAADSLPSISSINRIIRDKSLYDVRTPADDVSHDEVLPVVHNVQHTAAHFSNMLSVISYQCWKNVCPVQWKKQSKTKPLIFS